jgi:hypothetical protein
MEVKVVGSIWEGPAGSLRLEIDAAASGVDAVQVIKKSVGLVLDARLELAEVSTRQRAKGESQPTSHGLEGLSDCAHGDYWFPKKDKGR